MTEPVSESLGQAPVAKRSSLRKWGKRVAIVLVLTAVGAVAYHWWTRREPQASTEVYQGVTYGCDRFESTPEGSGLVHWVRVDLTAPGVSLYVTPLDPEAVADGWQYRLRFPTDVLAQENLAVVINGTLFSSDSGWVRLPGELARSVETVVSDHQVSHLWEHTYLLWFDDHLMPQLKPSKPPTALELAQAKWGIGGQGVGLRGGRVMSGGSDVADARTAVAVDRERMLLFLAVAEHATPHRILEKLAELGAKDGMLVDGGGSSSMVLGPDAHATRPGCLHNGWRPVATFFGVRRAPSPADNGYTSRGPK